MRTCFREHWLACTVVLRVGGDTVFGSGNMGPVRRSGGVLQGVAVAVVVAALALSFVSEGADAQQLTYRYYRTSCPRAESIIYHEVRKAFKRDPTIAPGLLRMIFHDCFVRGCDASVLLRGSRTERASIRNNRLHGFEVVDTIKASLEKYCPNTVSCADILAYASRDAVVVTGGSHWKVLAGRRDGRVSNVEEPEQNLPPATANAQELVSTFAQKGIRPEQMVILSGAHTLGVTHCEHVSNRLRPVDRTLPRDLLKKLQKVCPRPSSGTSIVLDQKSVHKFDSVYFQNVKTGRGVMTSDQDLYNPEGFLRRFVDKNTKQSTFVHRFGQAMFALTNIDPTLAPDGEIRKRCQYRNPTPRS